MRTQPQAELACVSSLKTRLSVNPKREESYNVRDHVVGIYNSVGVFFCENLLTGRQSTRSNRSKVLFRPGLNSLGCKRQGFGLEGSNRRTSTSLGFIIDFRYELEGSNR
jgi:hypothetical protein